MDIIHLLSEALANQIAAGEVVQRPASVLKELLENSIDAKANSIEIYIKEAGKNLIQVIDNGSGMSITDARMSFERHATSKIRTSNDLFTIKTMGFRGEALASIAAVAQVDLRSRREEDELGTQILAEASEIKSQESTTMPKGTNISVKNLFFNVPARRKFLKSNAVEMKHILEEFERQAIANPSVSFKLFHNDQLLYNLPDTTLMKRIVEVKGKNTRSQMAECNESTDFIEVRGYIGKPELAKKSRGDQYFYVNDRFIRSNYLNHAVTNAYEGLIPSGFQPFYVLFIYIDPSLIDINIHPTKTEIKFENESAVYAILRSTVKKAMGLYSLAPPIDFESDFNTSFTSIKPPAMVQSRHKMPSLNKSIVNFENDSIIQDRINFSPEPTFKSKANNNASTLIDLSTISAVQIHQKFIVAQVKSGMLLIDQKLALERIFFDKLTENLKHKKNSSQQLLFPKTLDLSVLDFETAKEIMEDLRDLGFGIEEFGNNTIIINGVPADLPNEDQGNMILNLLQQFRENENDLKIERGERIIRSLSKRAAALAIKKLEGPEIESLINRLFESSLPSTSPAGESIMKILSLDELSELISK